MPEMKCPICGFMLEPQEIYNGYCDSKTHEEEWYGRCPKCGKEYHWTLVFIYKDVVDFGEVKKDE